MTDNLPARRSTDSWTEMLEPVGTLATNIARTAFVPRAMQGNPAAVAAAILLGREMDLGPMASLRGIDVIEGKPSLTAQMLAARILAAGHRIEWETSTDQKATVSIERADGLAKATATWTLADAQRAGLAGRKVWQQYPRHMLRARALTECASMACPDVAMGLDVEAPLFEESGPAAASRTIAVQLERAEPEQLQAEPVEEAAPEPPEPPEELLPIPEPEQASEAPEGPTEASSEAGIALAAEMLGGEIVEEPKPARIRRRTMPANTQNDKPNASATPAQTRDMAIAFRAIGIGDGSRADRIAYVSTVIGREVASARELTREEAALVLEELQAHKLSNEMEAAEE